MDQSDSKSPSPAGVNTPAGLNNTAAGGTTTTTTTGTAPTTPTAAVSPAPNIYKPGAPTPNQPIVGYGYSPYQQPMMVPVGDFGYAAAEQRQRHEINQVVGWQIGVGIGICLCIVLVFLLPVILLGALK